MTGVNREKRDFYERLRYTILDAEKDELDEILRTLIRKDNARQFYNELFDGCRLDNDGELVRQGFFTPAENGASLDYALWTLLAYAPPDFPLKRGVRSIRLIAPAPSRKPVMHFPRRLDYFPALEQLGVVGWSVSAVPRELSRCTRLRFLSLRDNLFSQVPDPVLKLAKLTYLDMSLNRIGRLPKGIGSLTGLKTLALKGNLLAEVPPTLGELKRLETLDLGCNRLTSVPAELNRFRGKMDLSYNDLPPEEEAFWSLPSS